MRMIRFNLNFLLVLFLLMVATDNLQAQSRSFRIVGYVPNWIDVAAFSQNFDFKQVTHLNYAFQNPDAVGNLVESNDGLDILVKKAHLANVKVLVSLGGASAAERTIKTHFQNLISTSEKRAAFIHKIVVYLYKYNLDGLDVDEEGSAINSNYGAFIQQLSDSLKPKNKLLTAAVGWGAENIENSTLPFFDWVNLMAYDYTGNWDQTNPGQHSPYWYAQKMIKDWLARGVKKENLCLGVPFYGYGFYKSPGSFNYDAILARFPDAWQKDQVGDTIYYNGMNTIYKKTKLALAETSGVMIWELSNDVKGEKSLLNVISTTVDSLSTSVIPNLAKISGLSIYPNPASNYIIIETSTPDQTAIIEIIDVQGCLMENFNYRIVLDEGAKIDISSLNRGEYICRVTSPEGIFSKLFIKE
jgi:GH18 family chitinase